MRTIEELITSLEACTNGDSCKGCAYFDAHKDLTEGMNCDEYAIPEMQRDSLHYLKKYLEKEQLIAALPDYYELIQFWSESLSNEPLKWEELMEMSGKPVYTVINDRWDDGEWVIIRDIDDKCFTDETGVWTWTREEYGKKWFAYRKDNENA